MSDLSRFWTHRTLRNSLPSRASLSSSWRSPYLAQELPLCRLRPAWSTTLSLRTPTLSGVSPSRNRKHLWTHGHHKDTAPIPGAREEGREREGEETTSDERKHRWEEAPHFPASFTTSNSLPPPQTSHGAEMGPLPFIPVFALS